MMVTFVLTLLLGTTVWAAYTDEFLQAFRNLGLDPWAGMELGRTLLGCWFLVRFSDLILGSQDNGFIQESGVVAGTRVGGVILVPVFLGALVAVFLVVLVFFRALSWLQFRAWTRVGFLRGRLVVFFCCCFGWPFRCCLGRCFALCFCVVGCLAPGLDPCMLV